jgi:hypothetical protein
LAEVPPALVVDRDHRARADQAGELHGVARGHRVADWTADREPHGTEVQERGVDLHAAGDVAHAVVEDGVAGDPQRSLAAKR